jgi:hypothetical protein
MGKHEETEFKTTLNHEPLNPEPDQLPIIQMMEKCHV